MFLLFALVIGSAKVGVSFMCLYTIFKEGDVAMGMAVTPSAPFPNAEKLRSMIHV